MQHKDVIVPQSVKRLDPQAECSWLGHRTPYTVCSDLAVSTNPTYKYIMLLLDNN